MTRPTVTCPGCKKHPSEGDSTFWPFCSERCKMLDLGDWAAEKFKLAVKQSDSDPVEVKLESELLDEDLD